MATQRERDDGVPVISLESRTAPSAHSFELFREGATPMFEAIPVEDPSAFTSNTRDYLVDGLIVGRLRTEPYLMRRDGRHVADGGTDWILVQAFLHGQARGVVHGDHGLRLDTSNIGVVDLARRSSVVFDRSDMLAVCVPRERVKLSATLYRAAPSLAWGRLSGRGRLLADATSRLWRSLRTARAGDGPVLADRFIETLDRVLRPVEFVARDHAARLEADAFIAANLADLDLDAVAVGTAIGYSRSATYRLFEADGGVHRRIRTLRLQRCLEELSRPAVPQRRVSEIATGWGFENPSHFNRIFREAYDIAPSAVLRQEGPTASVTPLPGSVTEALRRLQAWERSAVSG